MAGPAASLPAVRRRSDGVGLLLVLVIAAAVRFPGLGRAGYTIDEYWKAELAGGRGSTHLHVPVDAVLRPPPDPFDLHDAGPWWRVWSNMECTHPPLYYLLLRGWMAAVGQGDAVERAFSALTSVVAVGLLFDATRVLHGRTVATWAGLLMAVAGPQVEQARLTSNYALELATVLAAVDAVARIEVLGASGRRFAGLGVAVLAALLTHYFAVGPLAGLGVYAVARLRGRSRRGAAAAFAAAGVAFAACWGPFMWDQRHLFSTADPATRFLRDDGPHHVLHVLWLAANVPAAMLAVVPGRVAAAGVAGCLLYVLPFALARRRPHAVLWAAVLLGTVGLTLALDLARGTQHLAYVRYLIPAGPAVCALVPALAIGNGRRLGQVVSAAAVAGCGLALPAVYRTELPSPRPLVADLRASAGPDDLILILGTGPDAWTTGPTYQLLTRYLRPFPSPLAIEHGPPGDAVRRAAAAGHRVFVLPLHEDPRPALPGLRPTGRHVYPGGLTVWAFTPAR